jgi:hypothetical protein
MTRLKLTTLSLLLLMPLGLIACLAGQQESTTAPAVSIAILGIDASTGRATIRVKNQLDRPVFLQGQPDAGVGFLIQKRNAGSGGSSAQRLTPLAQNLGPGQLRLEGGKTLDFDYDAGPPPTTFRVGILSSPSMDRDQWILAWSVWWDCAG